MNHTSSDDEVAVIQMLLACHPCLLSEEEIIREVGNEVRAIDALRRFEGLGLVHRLSGCYWATRSAMAAEEASTARPLTPCSPEPPL